MEGHLQFLFPSTDDGGDDDGEAVSIPTTCFAGHYDDRKGVKTVRVKRRGGVSIDMSNFQSIGEVGPGDSIVKVGAGVTRNTLNEALRCVRCAR